MGKAIQKLGRLQTVTRSLPGRDCGTCGAPPCAALAEDIVMERAGIDLCPYIAREKEDEDS
jgi:Na+-translocating ferredoxin:NAD+ oxidoreductase RNF subunit RnfB